MRKYINHMRLILTFFVLIMFMTSCNKNVKQDEVVDENHSACLIVDTAGINDLAFNYDAWNGLIRAKKHLNFKISYIESKSESEYKDNLLKATNDGYDIIFVVGYRLGPVLEEVASENPNQYYAILDYEYENTLSNVLAINFKDHESSFLVANLVAHMCNKPGIILGSDSDTINKFKFGFQAGMHYAAKKLNKQVDFVTTISNNFDDENLGAQLANELIQSGADVILPVAGNLAKGAITAAAKKNIYSIGIDGDLLDIERDHVLTSAMKLIGNAIYNICEDVSSGNYIKGVSKSIGLKEGGVGFSSTTGHLIPKEIIDKTEGLISEIIEGKLHVPYNQSTYDEFIKTLSK